MQFVSLNGITLHYRQDGLSEDAPIVFINSLGCDMRIWDGVVAHLMPHFSLIRFDKRGHGLSDAPPAPYTAPEIARDVNGLLNHLGIKRAILVGLSVGGIVALQTALDFPERVAALVLCDTAAKIGTDAYWDDRMNMLRLRGMMYLADAIITRWFTPKFAEQNPAIYQGFYNLLTRMPLEGYVGTCAVVRNTDLRDRLNEIRIPALVLCGAGDMATTPEVVRGLADSLPNARFSLIEEAAHIPSVEQPEAIANAIAEFVKEHHDAT